MSKDNETLKITEQCAMRKVSNSALKPNVVNNGNVFGTGNWYTFYCGKCGASMWNNQYKCDCGQYQDWS